MTVPRVAHGEPDPAEHLQGPGRIADQELHGQQIEDDAHVREMPYFDFPWRRGRWFTTFCPIVTPNSLAMAGRNLCISPYSLIGLTTSARNTFSEQP